MSTRPYTVHSMSRRREIAAEKEEAKKNVGIFTTNSTRQEVTIKTYRLLELNSTRVHSDSYILKSINDYLSKSFTLNK